MINYILIGTVFMFIVEYFSQSKIIDKYVPKKKRKKMKNPIPQIQKVAVLISLISTKVKTLTKTHRETP